MVNPEHPIEALHQARDAIEMAVSGQAGHPNPSVEELHAFGSAIVATVNNLSALSQVLTNQVGYYDKGEIERLAISDDPLSKLRLAALHMLELSEALKLAAMNADRFWGAIAHVDKHTHPPDIAPDE